MATNPYFTHTSNINEQDLIEDLVIESIQHTGVDIYYIPRTDVNVDYLLNEDIDEQFDAAIPIEMYISEVDGFGGDGEMFSKFGLEVKDRATFDVSKKRFAEDMPKPIPEEGDLIYFPLSKSLFEINMVEPEDPFFQRGKQYVWQLKCELFEFNNESFDTGVDEIDTMAVNFDFASDVDTSEYADNVEIETETDDFVSFDPSNPFGD